MQKSKHVIATYFKSDEEKRLQKTAEEELKMCESTARSSNEKAPHVPLALAPTEDCRTTALVPCTPPSTETAFSANVDWGGSREGDNSVGSDKESPKGTDTLSVNSSERYNWFNNDDLSSCTHNNESDDEDGDSDINVTYF